MVCQPDCVVLAFVGRQPSVTPSRANDHRRSTGFSFNRAINGERGNVFVSRVKGTGCALFPKWERVFATGGKSREEKDKRYRWKLHWSYSARSQEIRKPEVNGGLP